MKKIITILTLFLLFSCGYQPIYSKKQINENYDFSINSIGFSGENIINQEIKNILTSYIDVETKPKKYDLIINSILKKNITSKDKKGDPELFSINIKINLEVYKNDNLVDKAIFEESFEYKNKLNKFELEQYEQNIQRNIASKLAGDITKHLYFLK